MEEDETIQQRYGNNIWFTGMVTPESSTKLIRELYRMCLSGAPYINFFIHSPGGDAYSAMAIYDTVQSLPCSVNTIALGEAVSAGTILFMAGERRFITPNSVFRMHQGTFALSDKRYDFAVDELVNIKKYERKVRKLYIEQIEKVWDARRQTTASRPTENGGELCRSPEECVHNLFNTETELDAEDALQYGLATNLWDRQAVEQLMVLEGRFRRAIQ
jgi:ATP-dependent Clp protease protease subunit